MASTIDDSLALTRFAAEAGDDGAAQSGSGAAFLFILSRDAIPDDHLVRAFARVLDLSWVHAELAPCNPNVGRPSIDPVLMIQMLIIGYVFAIRSERALCRESASQSRLSLVLWTFHRRQGPGICKPVTRKTNPSSK